MENEIEATFLDVDKDLIRSKFSSLGFTLVSPEFLMRRKTFDIPQKGGLNTWGRVRQEYDKITMTIKEIRGIGIHDTYEVEVVVDNFDTAVRFLEACGLVQKAVQENLREIWMSGATMITIDTWPGLKPFVEIEGESEEIVKSFSGKLGFVWETALFGSADYAYEKELGIPLGITNKLPEVTFANPPKKISNT